MLITASNTKDLFAQIVEQVKTPAEYEEIMQRGYDLVNHNGVRLGTFNDVYKAKAEQALYERETGNTTSFQVEICTATI